VAWADDAQGHFDLCASKAFQDEPEAFRPSRYQKRKTRKYANKKRTGDKAANEWQMGDKRAEK
jgi:hypothetical protein